MGVSVVEAGHGEGAVQVDDLGGPGDARKFGRLGVGAGEDDASAGDGKCLNTLGLRGEQVDAGEDVTVADEGVDVGCGRLGKDGGGEDGGGEGGQK